MFFLWKFFSRFKKTFVYLFDDNQLLDNRTPITGIITNYKEVKTLLEQRGYVFESDTDTEVIAKLAHHLWVQHPNESFRKLVEQVVQQLVSRFIKRKYAI